LRLARAALTLAALTAASAALARDEPLWEAGIGAAGVHFPDYRGSSHSRNYALPAPYFVYRGDFLKADRNGLRAMFFKSDRIDMNLSVGASLPVHSGDNPARAGMPDLRPSIEIGPSLAAILWRADDARMKLDARIASALHRRPGVSAPEPRHP
jgi:outer membrane scaffolding protein for murein synthesis (MipA/OmpV family)